MPVFRNGDVAIHYEVHGEGPALLLLAPGGLRSTAGAWQKMPYNPLEQLAGAFRLVAMDQRNAGHSVGPITTEGWASYTADQIALLDHLGIDKFHVLGMCIGGPFIMGLIKAVPARVRSAVMLQPIGLDDNLEAFEQLVAGWRAEIGAAHPEADDETWKGFGEAMFGGGFMFGASREDVAACETPLLLLMGDDLYHPRSISEAVAGLAKNVAVIESWKEPENLPAAAAAIREFLVAH